MGGNSIRRFMEKLGVACLLAGNFGFKPVARPVKPDDSRLSDFFTPRRYPSASKAASSPSNEAVNVIRLEMDSWFWVGAGLVKSRTPFASSLIKGGAEALGEEADYSCAVRRPSFGLQFCIAVEAPLRNRVQERRVSSRATAVHGQIAGMFNAGDSKPGAR